MARKAPATFAHLIPVPAETQGQESQVHLLSAPPTPNPRRDLVTCRLGGGAVVISLSWRGGGGSEHVCTSDLKAPLSSIVVNR